MERLQTRARTFESENDTYCEPVSVPVGMITPQPSCSTAQEPRPSPQPTPVLPSATDVTPACSLPSTAEISMTVSRVEA